MLEQLKIIITALWQQDFMVLNNPHLHGLIYTILIITLILENGFLPAAFLPGDSFLLLTGVIIAQGGMNYYTTIILLTVASSIGCWLGYLQGKWLGKSPLIKRWLAHIPEKYYTKTEYLLHRYDILALLIARFTAFVRTIMPLLIGLTNIETKRFQFINIVSGFLWVLSLVSLGTLFGHSRFFNAYQDKIMMVLTLLPLVLIIFGITSSLYFVCKRKNK